ncbi:hypothetical protein WEI85_43980 [Actinomycetes bacterium KLBMP 9797]
MTHVRVRRLVAATAMAALLVLAPVTPAAAVPAIWHGTACASGAITEYAGSVTTNGTRQVSVAGWVQPCGEPTASAAFAIMRYYPDAAVRDGAQSYEAWDTPTGFRRTVTLDDPAAFVTFEEQYGGPLDALCVVRDYWSPLACVDVDAWGGGQPTVIPIPIDASPMRCVPKAVGERIPVLNPTCGSCV